MGAIIGIIIGVLAHVAYLSFEESGKPVDVAEPELSQIEPGKSIDWYHRFMEMEFSDIDTSQLLRDQTRVKRVEFTQSTLSQLTTINKRLGEPPVLRLYFGSSGGNIIQYMVMAYEADKAEEKGSDKKSESQKSQDQPRNQTDRIFLIEGPVPVCPYVCDHEGPYTH